MHNMEGKNYKNYVLILLNYKQMQNQEIEAELSAGINFWTKKQVHLSVESVLLKSC